MASNNGGGKEERRRRIAERGSDRMALITGRINALPPTPSSTASSPAAPPVSRHAQSLSAAAAFDSQSDNENEHLPPRHMRPQSALPFGADYPEDLTGDPDGKPRPTIFAGRLTHSGGFRYSHLENLEFKSEEEPLIQGSDTVSEVNNQVSEGDDNKIKSPSITSGAENEAHETQLTPALDTQLTPADDTQQAPAHEKQQTPPAHDTQQTPAHDIQRTPAHDTQRTPAHDTQRTPAHDTQLKKPCAQKPTLFSSREINSCIIASENTRALSSLIIALLVVFYYMISESILASRPLYIVLLTDITIVLARLYREKPRVLEETEGEKVEADGNDRHSWGDAVKLLERGLVVYQAIRGFFIDCSIYIVVVVCGISLM